MTKEVLLHIKGMQFVQETETEEADNIETICPGEYYYRNHAHYILYEEMIEGESTPVKTMIKIRDEECMVTKKGIYQVQMVFEKGKKTLTDYSTPFGNIMIGLDTNELVIKEAENHISLLIKYGLEANYQFVADCTIEIEVQAHEKSSCQ